MSDTKHIFDRINDLVNEAVSLGIPPRYLYLGTVKMHEFTEALERDGAHAPYSSCVTENTFRGLKIVRSRDPGMGVGR